MKTAVYICGLLKAFESTYESINKYLVLPNNADVYVCVWDRLGIQRKHAKVANLKLKDRPVTDEDVQRFQNVVDFKIVPFEDGVTDKIGDVSVPKSVKGHNPIHYYSTIPLSFMVKKCHALPKKKYDRYVKIRPDLKFLEPFNVKKKFPKEDTLYSSTHRINKGIQVSDKFVGGDYDAFSYYASLYDRLNDYWRGNPKGPVGERMLRHHMLKGKPKIEYFNSDLKIVREDLK